MTEASIEQQKYLRPLYVAIFLSVFGEAIIFVAFGLILFPDGSILNKALWTLIFCGLGMGATTGAAISLFVVKGNYTAKASIMATVVISILFLGLACNALCLNLDLVFHYFGAHTNPTLFFVNGVVQSAIGGLIAGLLLFTPQGNHILERIGI